MHASSESDRGIYSLLLCVQKLRGFWKHLSKFDTGPLQLYSFETILFADTVNTGNSFALIFNQPVSEEYSTLINSGSGLIILSRLWTDPLETIVANAIARDSFMNTKIVQDEEGVRLSAENKVRELNIRHEAENASISRVLISRYIRIVFWWCLDGSCAEFKVFLSSKPNSEEPIVNAVFLKLLAKYPDESLYVQKDGSDSPLSSWDAHLLSVVVLNNQLFSSRNVLTLRQSNFYA